MNIDELINDALTKTSLQGEGIFIVEGNGERKILRTKAADEAFKDGINSFAWDINTGFAFLGIFAEEKDAKEYISSINQGHTMPGKLPLWIVEGNPATNELRSLPVNAAIQNNFDDFAGSNNSGFLYMGIFANRNLAELHIYSIRKGIRNESGERLI